MTSTAAEQSKPSTRRSTSDVRAALLAAATATFADKGYAGSSTKEIAAAARTSEATIYRHFNSKSDLFTAAVLAPLLEFLTEYETFFERSMAEDDWTDEALIKECVEQLFHHLLHNRDAMRALITAHGDPESESAARDAIRRLNDFFHRLNELGEQRAPRSDAGFDAGKLHLTHRFLVGLIFDVTALHPWFVPDGWNHPTERQLIDELTNFVLYGFVGRPRTDPAKGNPANIRGARTNPSPRSRKEL